MSGPIRCDSVAPAMPPVYWVRLDELLDHLYVRREGLDDVLMARVCTEDGYPATMRAARGRPDVVRVDFDPPVERFAVPEWDVGPLADVLAYNKLGFYTRKAGEEGWKRGW